MVPYTSDVLIECVPNISEGRDQGIVEAVAAAMRRFAEVRHVDSDVDHNRSVLTCLGDRAGVAEAAFACVTEAARRIDLSLHSGEHPRLGAADVLPFVPLRDATLEDCAALAREVAKRVRTELKIPTYLYGVGEPSLPEVRRWATDAHPTAGATMVGARDVLIAFNVQLESTDLAAARSIAREVRHMPAVRALAFHLESRGCVQVSMNLVDWRRTSPLAAFRAVERLADDRGLAVRDSEVVGMIPAEAVPAGFVDAARCRPLALLEIP